VKTIQKYGYTTVIIISRKSTDRHYNGQKENNGPQATKKKTEDGAN